MCNFGVSVCKTNFTEHHIPNTTHGFRDQVKCTTVWYGKISSISIPSHQAMRAITMSRWKQSYTVWRSACTYSNCIVYRLFYYWKITYLTNICSEISKIEMNLWMLCIILAIWRALECKKEGKNTNVLCIVPPKSWEICGCTRPF